MNDQHKLEAMCVCFCAAMVTIVLLTIILIYHKGSQSEDEREKTMITTCIQAGNEWRPMKAPDDHYSSMSCVKPQQ